MTMLQINHFKTIKLTSHIIDYGSLSESKNDITMHALLSHHAPVKFHTVSEKRACICLKTIHANRTIIHTCWTRNFQLVIKSTFV